LIRAWLGWIRLKPGKLVQDPRLEKSCLGS
jgi:hypothetical protein